MSSRPAPSVSGEGAPELDLRPAQLREILEQALLSVAPGARVLGYMDYRQFRREEYEADAGTLVVERAGRDLYLVEPQ